jgi:N-acetylated-alpha-linked acidic dipeptidase
MGAADPTSGTVSVHEIVRGLGHLMRNGWKPLRTILIASWDAEEVSDVGLCSLSTLTYTLLSTA